MGGVPRRKLVLLLRLKLHLDITADHGKVWRKTTVPVRIRCLFVAEPRSLLSRAFLLAAVCSHLLLASGGGSKIQLISLSSIFFASWSPSGVVLHPVNNIISFKWLSRPHRSHYPLLCVKAILFIGLYALNSWKAGESAGLRLWTGASWFLKFRMISWAEIARSM